MKRIVGFLIGVAVILAAIPSSTLAATQYEKNLNVVTTKGLGTSQITLMKGDFDFNGIIDSQDENAMSVLVANPSSAGAQLELADFNDDGSIDLADFTYFRNVIGGAEDIVLYRAEGTPENNYVVSAISYKGISLNVPTKTDTVKTTVIGGKTLTATLKNNGSVVITGITSGRSGEEQRLEFSYKSEFAYIKNLVATSDKNGSAKVSLMKLDMDSDDDIDADDINIITGIVSANSAVSPEYLLKADLNDDGALDLIDISNVKSLVSGGAKFQIYNVEDTPKAGYKVKSIVLNNQKLNVPSGAGKSAKTTIDGKDITVSIDDNEKVEVIGIMSGTSGIKQTIKFVHAEEDKDTKIKDDKNKKKKPDDKDKKEKDSTDLETAKTGDDSNMVVWISLMAVACVGAAIIIKQKRKA